MKRQTAKSYDNLISAGIELAGDYGLEGFNIRQLCAKAGVNLGMFHYYFKTKDAFDKIIFKKVYADMISNINVQLSSKNNPKENIRFIIKSMTVFYETNKGLIIPLLQDFVSGNKRVRKFLFTNFTKHLSIIKNEINRAKKLKAIADLPTLNLMCILVAPVMLPHLVFDYIKKTEPQFLKNAVDAGKFNNGIVIDFLLNAAFKNGKRD